MEINYKRPPIYDIERIFSNVGKTRDSVVSASFILRIAINLRNTEYGAPHHFPIAHNFSVEDMSGRFRLASASQSFLGRPDDAMR